MNFIILPNAPMFYEFNPILYMSTNIWSFLIFSIATNAFVLLFMVYPEKIVPPIPAILIQTVLFFAIPLVRIFVILHWANLLLVAGLI